MWGNDMNDFKFNQPDWGKIEDGYMAAQRKYEIGQNLNDPVVMEDAKRDALKLKEGFMSDPRMKQQGSMDYMASAYYAQNPVASQAKYGSSISGEMMPGAKRTEEQNKTGMNPLYSDPEFLKYIAQYGFDQYGRKIRR